MYKVMLIAALVIAGSLAAWAQETKPAESSAQATVEMPLTNVVLFSSGVGYFERAGKVTNNAAVRLSFKPEQINDLLKSMVLLDFDGGKVGTVTYGAKDPISKTLGAFAVNLTDNPSLGQLLNRLRGVPAQVMATNLITGKILGVETKRKVVGEEIVEVEVLNLLTDDGIKSVRLDEISSIRLLDERMNRELQEALAVLATGLDNQRKPVVVTFTGAGERRVAIGYLSETPVWKTSYRLVLPGDDAKGNSALLQGWAVVENTSDADWTNVRLSLVSGRPISFIQDLYTPLYVNRPVVQTQTYASIQPVQYQAAVEMREELGMAMPEPSLDFNGAMPAGKANGRAQALGVPPTANGISAGASTVSAATATNLGQAFEYTIATPVTLPRQQSALLPIVNGNVEAWGVSIYNPNVHAKFPLYGARVKNNTGVHLMGGPITIYNHDVYAGDATFEDLQPGEQRLVSYAIDLGVQGERQEAQGAEEIIAVKISKGSLVATRKLRRTVDYTFAVKDGKDRKLIVEHQFRPGWKLVEPAKADERTDSLYRFNVALSGKQGGKLAVVEEYTTDQIFRIVDLDTNTLVLYQRTGAASRPVREALQKIADMQGHIQDLRRQRTQHEQEIRAINEEQNRIRQNMSALDRNSDLYKRYVTKFDEQETRIEALRAQNADLQKQEDAQRKALEEYVAGLNLD